MRKIFSFCVMVVTVLTVNIVTGLITDYLMKYKGMTNPFKFTAIGMVITVAVLYPAFKFVDEIIKSMAQKVMSKGHHAFGKLIGTLVVFAVVMFILYCVYANNWFHINVPKYLIGRIGN